MIEVAFVLACLGIAAIVLAIITNMSKDMIYVQFLGLFFIALLIYLIPSYFMVYQDCQYVVNSTNQAAGVNMTNSSYINSLECTSVVNKPISLLYQIMTWFIRLFGAFLVVYPIYWVVMNRRKYIP